MAVIRNKGKRLNKYLDNYVVFDLETTGVSVVSDSIIEISAVKVRNHQIEEKFSTLVNPGRHIPPAATAVNGITDEMVQTAPELADALSGFLEFTDGEILVGHNIHCFDLNFVYDAVMELFQREVCNDYVDTLYMARMCLPELKHHKLTDLAEYFHISAEGAHRALCDCMMNQSCYEKLGELLGAVKLERCPKCGGDLNRRSGKFGAFYGCSNYPICRYTRNI